MTARQEGYEAYKSGMSLDDNPYRKSGEKDGDYVQWQEGWYDAEAEVLEQNDPNDD